MSKNTKIAWCDSTVNFWIGCTPVSSGCQNCYAKKMDDYRFSRTLGGGTKEKPIIHFGSGAPRYKCRNILSQLEQWNKKQNVCNKCGKDVSGLNLCYFCNNMTELHKPYFHRRRVFVNDLSDWLDPEVPIEWFIDLLTSIQRCKDINFITCTKRPELFKSRIEEARRNKGHWNDVCGWNSLMRLFEGRSFPNLTVLTTVENQKMADRRIPELMKIPAVCHGLSIEPMLEKIDLGSPIYENPNGGKTGAVTSWKGGIDWVIVGGESGTNARPCHVMWIKDIVDQCKAAKVPVFVKQLGSKSIISEPLGEDRELSEFLKKLKSNSGSDPEEWPQSLRIREFPRDLV